MEPLSPQEQAWTDELDREGWSFADVMRQRDDWRARAERAEKALDRVRDECRPYLGGNDGWSPVVDFAQRISAAIEGSE